MNGWGDIAERKAHQGNLGLSGGKMLGVKSLLAACGPARANWKAAKTVLKEAKNMGILASSKTKKQEQIGTGKGAFLQGGSAGQNCLPFTHNFARTKSCSPAPLTAVKNLKTLHPN